MIGIASNSTLGCCSAKIPLVRESNKVIIGGLVLSQREFWRVYLGSCLPDVGHSVWLLLLFVCSVLCVCVCKCGGSLFFFLIFRT